MLAQKYQALLDDAARRGVADVDGIRLCFQLLSCTAAIDRDCAARLAPHGLSEGRFVLLFLLDGADTPLSPHELADRAGVTRATITGLLDGLARNGLIVRDSDPHDRRALRIHLTAAGQALARTLVLEHTAWIASLFKNLDDDERQQLATLLTKVMP
ncbi:MAG: MarR family transcriptional regulator [Cardiobacteriaceae bacterium]|nr:MarR family transcriptional regulator [Cardiobacteriaceae bacterium]